MYYFFILQIFFFLMWISTYIHGGNCSNSVRKYFFLLQGKGTFQLISTVNLTVKFSTHSLIGKQSYSKVGYFVWKTAFIAIFMNTVVRADMKYVNRIWWVSLWSDSGYFHIPKLYWRLQLNVSSVWIKATHWIRIWFLNLKGHSRNTRCLKTFHRSTVLSIHALKEY